MPLVTVKPRFQVTIPAKLRRDLDLSEGDLMEATIVGDGVLLRPKAVVNRNDARTAIDAETITDVGCAPEESSTGVTGATSRRSPRAAG